jgi:hypothetical protein
LWATNWQHILTIWRFLAAVVKHLTLICEQQAVRFGAYLIIFAADKT